MHTCSSFYLSPHNRDLHSFPTRRSSDLRARKFSIASGRYPCRAYSMTDVAPCRLLKRFLSVPRMRGTCANCGKRSEEHTSELQSHSDLVCRLLLEKKKKKLNTEYLHVIR